MRRLLAVLTLLALSAQAGREQCARLWDEHWLGVDGAGNLYVAPRTLPNELGDAPVRIRKVIAGAL